MPIRLLWAIRIERMVTGDILGDKLYTLAKPGDATFRYIMKNNFRVGLIGTGSWDLHWQKFFCKKNKVSLFLLPHKNFGELNKNHRASKFLPGIKIFKRYFLA